MHTQHFRTTQLTDELKQNGKTLTSLTLVHDEQYSLV